MTTVVALAAVGGPGVAGVPRPAFADTAVLTIPRVSRPPAVDDFLRKRPREAEAAVDTFTQREPGDGVPASGRTTAYLSYDSDHLYVVFVCEDGVDRARAHLARREAIEADDQVAVLLDTFHDRRRAYRFAVNPLGVQADALLTEGQPDDFSYDTVWQSEGRLTPSGFVVAIAIPFRSLRLPPASVQRWGVALARIIPRNSEEAYWPPITRRIEGLMQQFATLEGLSDVSGGRNVQVIPYGTLVASSIGAHGDGATRDADARLGFDAKVVIRDALTMDVAVNPDFSQVESDQPQVTTNQRFEVFFPERRPFFVENAGFFLYGAIPAVRNVPETLFFSRRIVDPGIGARLTGKLGRWAIGGLAMNDRATTVSNAPGSRDAAIGVVRVQREWGGQSAVGILGSSRGAGGDANRVGAVDARVKLGSNWVVMAFAAASRTHDRGNGSRAGLAINVNANRTSRRLLYNAFYSDRSPSFAAALGFVPRTDIRQIEQYVEYRWRPAAGPVVAYGPNSYFRFNWDRQGRLQEWIVRFPFQIDLKGRTSIFVRRVESAELFRDIRFREHLQTINVTTEWLRWLSVNESFETGTTVNFFPPPGIAPHPASFLTASAALGLRAAPQLQVDLRYLFNGLRPLPHEGGQARTIFSNHVARLRVNYQFTRALSMRAILDYRAVQPDEARVTLVRDRHIAMDLLAAYLPHPGTAFYAGYAGAQDRPGPIHGFDSIGAAPRQVSTRQLFVKANYLVRF